MEKRPDSRTVPHYAVFTRKPIPGYEGNNARIQASMEYARPGDRIEIGEMLDSRSDRWEPCPQGAVFETEAGLALNGEILLVDKAVLQDVEDWIPYRDGVLCEISGGRLVLFRADEPKMTVIYGDPHGNVEPSQNLNWSANLDTFVVNVDGKLLLDGQTVVHEGHYADYVLCGKDVFVCDDEGLLYRNGDLLDVGDYDHWGVDPVSGLVIDRDGTLLRHSGETICEGTDDWCPHPAGALVLKEGRIFVPGDSEPLYHGNWDQHGYAYGYLYLVVDRELFMVKDYPR